VRGIWAGTRKQGFWLESASGPWATLGKCKHGLITSENALGQYAPPPHLGKCKRVLITSQGGLGPKGCGVSQQVHYTSGNPGSHGDARKVQACLDYF